MQQALERALSNAGVRLRQLDGLIAVPSLSEPRFMEAHYLATKMGLLPSKGVVVRTIDTGGAGPISGLLEADILIRTQGLDLVAVVAGDAVSSMPTDEFLKRADAGRSHFVVMSYRSTCCLLIHAPILKLHLSSIYCT